MGSRYLSVRLSVPTVASRGFVLSTPPLRRSQAADETAARALRRRRRLRTDSGAMAILDVFVIGVWIAAGAGVYAA
jgi:hypothetical protein